MLQVFRLERDEYDDDGSDIPDEFFQRYFEDFLSFMPCDGTDLENALLEIKENDPDMVAIKFVHNPKNRLTERLSRVKLTEANVNEFTESMRNNTNFRGLW